MDIDYHAVGEDIITASNTVDNDEAHADSNPSVERESDSSCSGSSIIINESYDINKAKLEDEAQQFS